MDTNLITYMLCEYYLPFCGLTIQFLYSDLSSKFQNVNEGFPSFHSPVPWRTTLSMPLYP